MLDEEPEALEGHEPEARAITREAIGESLDSLCAMQREALVLKVHGGYTYREIADVLGITFDEARGRIERARRHIRRVSA
jgi:RNA polymerase sigma factor (sigma-70 family)